MADLKEFHPESEESGRMSGTGIDTAFCRSFSSFSASNCYFFPYLMKNESYPETGIFGRCIYAARQKKVFRYAARHTFPTQTNETEETVYG